MRSGKQVVFCSKRCKQRIENEEAKDALMRMDLREEFGNALLRADLDFVRDCASVLSLDDRRRIFREVEAIVNFTVDLLRRGESVASVRKMLERMNVKAVEETIESAREMLRVLG